MYSIDHKAYLERILQNCMSRATTWKIYALFFKLHCKKYNYYCFKISHSYITNSIGVFITDKHKRNIKVCLSAMEILFELII